MYASIILFVPYGSDFQMMLRFPVFFLGTVLGKLIKENECMCSKKYSICLLGLMFFIGFALSVYAFIYCNPSCGLMEVSEIKKTGWLFAPYIFMVTFVCLMICSLFEMKNIKFLLPFLKNIGVMSIEIYLLHGQFISLTRYLTNEYGWSKPLVGAIMIMLCFVMSWYIHKLNCWMMNKLKSIK